MSSAALHAFLRLERGALVWTRRLALAAGWMLLGVASVTVADALLRKFFSRPIQGTFEATQLMLAAIVFFALPYTGLTDGHVSVELLTRRLPRRAQSAVIALNCLVCAALLAFIADQMGLLGAEYARTARTTLTTRIPVFPFVAAVTGAAWLAMAGFVVQAAGAGLRAIRPELPGPGAGEARAAG